MKIIKLTQNKYVLVDDEDYTWLNQFKWYFAKGYAIRNTSRKDGKKKIYMHREIIKTPKGLYTDHKNFDSLDNRKTNLRICTKRQNQIHQLNSRNKTGYRGISWSKRDNAWVVQISSKPSSIIKKQVKNKELAIKIYNQWSQKYYGEFGIKHQL